MKMIVDFFVIEMLKFRGLSPTLITELIPQIKIGMNCEIMPIWPREFEFLGSKNLGNFSG